MNLCGRWLHSHEEDTADSLVYRSADFAFPPSRGRYGFELIAGGALYELGPGPADAPTAATGTWTMPSPGELHLHGPQGHRCLFIVSATPDKLIVRDSTARAISP